MASIIFLIYLYGDRNGDRVLGERVDLLKVLDPFFSKLVSDFSK